MEIRRRSKRLINLLLKPFGHEIGSLLYSWKKYFRKLQNFTQSKLPEEAEQYLNPANPRLKELRERYALCGKNITAPSIWTDVHVSPHDIAYFRGDNAYVWQLRGQNMTIAGYVLTAYYVKSIDILSLLDTLPEDDYFGNITFRIDNKIISRDLLDSIIEIYFLEKHLNISSLQNLRILDIGAGYGRLAHRMIQALPNIDTYLCTDAVAPSTFISEYYLRFRDLGERAKVIPLDEIESTLETQHIDIAVNIHSFSECRVAAIEWWLSLLQKNRIKCLMIAPNVYNEGGALLQNEDGFDFQKIIEKHGYTLAAKEPKYRDPLVQKYAITPTYHYLFVLN